MRALYLLLLPLLLFAACSSDEVETPVITKDVTITLGAAGGRTTRADADPNALDHELISSLDVFIVNSSNTITNAYHYSASDLGSQAEEGNVPRVTLSIEDFTLGTYTVYAFANFDNCYSTTNTTTTLAAQLDAITTSSAKSDIVTLGNLIANNPASTIDFSNGHFIPMATDTTITIGSSTDNTVYMHRLVSRIDVTATNTRKTDITINSLSMGSFADGVVLFPSTHNPQVINTTAIASNQTIAITPAVTIPAGTTTPQTVASFYVNATENSSHGKFNIDIKLDGEEANYEGSTTRTMLPRNSIFPLSLSFAEYEVQFNVEAQIAPIGGYPVTVKTLNALTGDLVLEIPEGCTFTVTPTIQRYSADGVTTTPDTKATFTWSVPTTLPDWFSYTLTNNGTNTATLSGKVSAEAGLSFSTNDADGQVITLTSTDRNGKVYTNRLRFTTYAIDNTTK